MGPYLSCSFLCRLWPPRYVLHARLNVHILNCISKGLAHRHARLGSTPFCFAADHLCPAVRIHLCDDGSSGTFTLPWSLLQDVYFFSQISLNLLAQIIPGTLLPGQPLANMLFKAYSVQTLTESTSFVQDLKLGHYIKVPPRATFLGASPRV